MFKNIVFVLFILPFLSGAQNYLEIGDKFFNHNNFKQAISYYEKESQNQDITYKILAQERLGQTYIKLHDFESAYKWLTEAYKLDSKNAKLVLQIAETLKKQKKYDEAKQMYTSYLDLSKDQSVVAHLSFCDSLKSWNNASHAANYEVFEFKKANSEYRDFSPTIFRDSIYFVSDRGNTAKGNKGVLDHKYAIPHLDFYVMGFNKSSNDHATLSAVPFKQLQTGHHEGPMVFGDSGKTLLFTRTNSGLKSPYQNIHPTQLFTAYKTANGTWSKPHNKFNMNSIEHSTGHPSISKDGKTLVFMADAGSNFSNSNIYVAKWNANTQNWGEFRPLGDHINTRSNELFPFFDENMNLYFSSVGLPGYGGLDVFFAKYNPKKDDWEKPVNLKAPINSEYDDFGFYMYGNSGSGFFSSNRTGGTGGDDMYIYGSTSLHVLLDHNQVKVEKSTFFNGMSTKFLLPEHSLATVEETDKYHVLKLAYDDSTYTMATDKANTPYNKVDFVLEKPSANVKYALQATTHEVPVNLQGILKDATGGNIPAQKIYVFENEVLADTLATDAQGKYSYQLQPEKRYRIAQLDSITQDMKPKYLRLEVVNSKNQGLSNVEVQIMKQGKSFVKFVTSSTSNVVRVSNHTTLQFVVGKKYHIGVDTSLSIALPKGSDTLDLKLRLREIPSFVLKGHVFENYKGDKLGIKGVDIEFHYKGKIIDQNHSYENGDFEIRAYPNEKINLTLNKRGYVGIDTVFQLDTAKVKHVAIELRRITEGATVQLKEIYFDYNSASITKESVPNLEKMAKFLKANPGMKVELSSHTDVRGNANYNIDLSQRRADHVAKFLIHRGIKPNKLHAVGYGASQPIIKDAQTEEQHAINRRTEIKILKMDEAHGAEFKYRLVLKTSSKPLDTSDEIFEKFPLLKSTSIDNGDLIYFTGPFEHIDEVKKQWQYAVENGFADVYGQKLVGNIVVEKIGDFATLKE